ncbi:MAG: 50S ribosomal protein L10 [bacterium]
MPKSKAQKAAVIDELSTALRSSQYGVVTDFAKLAMVDLDKFRRLAREKGMRYTVIKPTLARVAAKAAGIEALELAKTGKSYGLVWGGKDEVSVSKLAHEFAKGSDDRVHITVGILEGRVVAAEIIQQLALLPSYEELIGRLLSSINAPISNFVYAMNWNLQSFYNVVKAIQANK